MLNYSSFIVAILAVIGYTMLYKYNISESNLYGIFTFLFMMIIVLLCANYKEGMSKKYIELNNYLTILSSEPIFSLNID
ncbi:hypothetical protein DB91_01290 [Ehrlichia sp. Wisconsin_h]|nr:hypothetical protein DB91_01290 [Ehrlichia sp. Wisconsin_h]